MRISILNKLPLQGLPEYCHNPLLIQPILTIPIDKLHKGRQELLNRRRGHLLQERIKALLAKHPIRNALIQFLDQLLQAAHIALLIPVPHKVDRVVCLKVFVHCLAERIELGRVDVFQQPVVKAEDFLDVAGVPLLVGGVEDDPSEFALGGRGLQD